MAAAPAYVSDDLAAARDKVRWFPALVSDHVVDLINKYPKDDLPEELWRYVEKREGYDYLHHAEVGSDNAAFVSTRSPTSSRSSDPPPPTASGSSSCARQA